jgi:hypothetical protein
MQLSVAAQVVLTRNDDFLSSHAKDERARRRRERGRFQEPSLTGVYVISDLRSERKDEMNAKQRKHLASLKRRRDRLAERVAGYRADGNVDTAKRELSAVNFAIAVIENCEIAGILDEVSVRS